MVVFLLHKLNIPSIVGFLVAWVIIGPHGVGLVKDTYAVEVMAEIGVMGANEVIPEEFETSVEIFSRVLQQYHFPTNMIMEMVDRVRSGSYTALRKLDIPSGNLFEQCE